MLSLKKIAGCVAAVGVVLCLASTALASPVAWYWANTSGDWTNPATWGTDFGTATYPGYAGQRQYRYFGHNRRTANRPYTVSIHAGNDIGETVNVTTSRTAQMGIYQLYLGGRPTIGRYVSSIWCYPNSKAGPGIINIDGGTLTVQNAYLGDYYGGTVSQSGGMVNIGNFYLGNNVLPITQQARI